jgi:hypothetical protein
VTRREFEPANAGDKTLVKRIGELMEARQATERALAEAVNEYARRRVELVRKGQPIQGPLAEPIAPSEGFQAYLANRERLAAQNFTSDEMASRDPRTRTLLAGEG